mmetsp:Transcript_74556/g.199391  ORF Transcript_74556/g.199391 Transcript_74556/m.199391 type:complete len:1596 (-) Transcript_74556:922-5709(-)
MGDSDEDIPHNRTESSDDDASQEHPLAPSTPPAVGGASKEDDDDHTSIVSLDSDSTNGPLFWYIHVVIRSIATLVNFLYQNVALSFIALHFLSSSRIFIFLLDSNSQSTLQFVSSCSLPVSHKLHLFSHMLNSIPLPFPPYPRFRVVSKLAPKARNCHTATMVGNTMLVFGGFGGSKRFDDLWSFDANLTEWHQPELERTTDSMPPSRYAHSAVSYRGLLYVFGGYGGAAEGWLGDLWALDTQQIRVRDHAKSKMKWFRPPTSGPQPPARAAHTATVVGNRLYIFGGNNGSVRLNDLHSLDMQTMTWRLEVCRGRLPSPRAGHTATLLEPPPHYAATLASSSPSSSSVVAVAAAASSTSTSASHASGGGSALQLGGPCSSSSLSLEGASAGGGGAGASAVSMMGGGGGGGGGGVPGAGARLLVFAGGDIETVFNDVHVLQMDTLRWSQPRASGPPPSPRAGHCACTLPDSCILIWGGGSVGRVLNDLHVLDPATWTWSGPIELKYSPEPRVGHTVCLHGTDMFVFGGGDSRTIFGDLTFLDTQSIFDHCNLRRLRDSDRDGSPASPAPSPTPSITASFTPGSASCSHAPGLSGALSTSPEASRSPSPFSASTPSMAVRAGSPTGGPSPRSLDGPSGSEQGWTGAGFAGVRASRSVGPGGGPDDEQTEREVQKSEFAERATENHGPISAGREVVVRPEPGSGGVGGGRAARLAEEQQLALARKLCNRPPREALVQQNILKDDSSGPVTPNILAAQRVLMKRKANSSLEMKLFRRPQLQQLIITKIIPEEDEYVEHEQRLWGHIQANAQHNSDGEDNEDPPPPERPSDWPPQPTSVSTPSPYPASDRGSNLDSEVAGTAGIVSRISLSLSSPSTGPAAMKTGGSVAGRGVAAGASVARACAANPSQGYQAGRAKVVTGRGGLFAPSAAAIAATAAGAEAAAVARRRAAGPDPWPLPDAAATATKGQSKSGQGNVQSRWAAEAQQGSERVFPRDASSSGKSEQWTASQEAILRKVIQDLLLEAETCDSIIQSDLKGVPTKVYDPASSPDSCASNANGDCTAANVSISPSSSASPGSNRDDTLSPSSPPVGALSSAPPPLNRSDLPESLQIRDPCHGVLVSSSMRVRLESAAAALRELLRPTSSDAPMTPRTASNSPALGPKPIDNETSAPIDHPAASPKLSPGIRPSGRGAAPAAWFSAGTNPERRGQPGPIPWPPAPEDRKLRSASAGSSGSVGSGGESSGGEDAASSRGTRRGAPLRAQWPPPPLMAEPGVSEGSSIMKKPGKLRQTQFADDGRGDASASGQVADHQSAPPEGKSVVSNTENQFQTSVNAEKCSGHDSDNGLQCGPAEWAARACSAKEWRMPPDSVPSVGDDGGSDGNQGSNAELCRSGDVGGEEITGQENISSNNSHISDVNVIKASRESGDGLSPSEVNSHGVGGESDHQGSKLVPAGRAVSSPDDSNGDGSLSAVRSWLDAEISGLKMQLTAKERAREIILKGRCLHCVPPETVARIRQSEAPGRFFGSDIVASSGRLGRRSGGPTSTEAVICNSQSSVKQHDLHNEGQGVTSEDIRNSFLCSLHSYEIRLLHSSNPLINGKL